MNAGQIVVTAIAGGALGGLLYQIILSAIDTLRGK